MAEGKKPFLTDDQARRLSIVEDLLGSVQCELCLDDDKLPPKLRTDNWRRLYGIRIELGREIDRLRKATRKR